jgi:hypothetical protein
MTASAPVDASRVTPRTHGQCLHDLSTSLGALPVPGLTAKALCLERDALSSHRHSPLSHDLSSSGVVQWLPNCSALR